MRKRFRVLPVALSFASLLIASSAAAQDQPPPAPPGTGQPSGAPAPSPEGEDKDGVRFRGAVNGAFGGIFGSESSVSYSGFLGGVNGHIGVQINDLIGIYGVPHLAFGSLTGSVTSGATSVDYSTGWLAFTGTGIVDFTFIDQIFVGAGGGFAAHAPTCTNCSGLSGGALHLRLGGYPLMDTGEDGIRRKGLMVSGDLRVNFLSVSGSSGASITLLQPMLSVGYEAY